MMVCDSLGHLIELHEVNRIISLVPSWTEFICDIGSEEKIVARTDYCVEPTSIKKVESIGGTKNPNIRRILELKPDLVIANKEENKQFDINRLRANNIEVLMTSAIQVNQAFYEMRIIESLITGSHQLSHRLSKNLMKKDFRHHFTFLYLIWNDPVMAAGKLTYISNVLNFHGGENVVDRDRYPKIRLDDYQKINPDIIFLPDEPFEFNDNHKSEIAKKFPNSIVELVDGKTMSWYGKRIKYVQNLIENLLP